MPSAELKMLICNADDFGLSKPITDAIITCHVNGIIRSTTLMANMPTAEYACQRAKRYPELGVGIHLNLTEGRPVLEPEKIPDLIDKEGLFLSSVLQCSQLWYGDRIASQVEAEFSAQIDRALEMGIQPTHCDSHHGIQKRPIARQALIRACNRYGIPFARTHRGCFWTGPRAPFSSRLQRIYRNARNSHRISMRWWNHRCLRMGGLKTPDRLISLLFLIPNAPNPKKQMLMTLGYLPDGICEMIFHPGVKDNEIYEPQEFKGVRLLDAQLACDLEVLAAIRKHRIRLVSFQEALG